MQFTEWLRLFFVVRGVIARYEAISYYLNIKSTFSSKHMRVGPAEQRGGVMA
jgi:hypothetical protein